MTYEEAIEYAVTELDRIVAELGSEEPGRER